MGYNFKKGRLWVPMVGSSIEFQPVHHFFYEFIAASSIPSYLNCIHVDGDWCWILWLHVTVSPSHVHTNTKELETSVLWGCFMMDLGKSCCLFSLVKCEFTLEIANKQKTKTCFLGNGTTSVTLCGASLPYVNVIHPWESICPELWRRTVGHGQYCCIEYQRYPKMMEKDQETGKVDDKDIHGMFSLFMGRIWQSGKKMMWHNSSQVGDRSWERSWNMIIELSCFCH